MERRHEPLEWSDELKAIFGWAADRDDLRLRTFMDAIHPDDQPRVKSALRQAIADRTTFDEECRIVRADGELRWIAGKGRAEYDAAGEPVRMMGVALDITERKRAEQEVIDREAQLAEAQRIAHVGSYEWDIGGDRVSRSEELCRIFGLQAEAFPPTFEAYLERVHPEDRPATRAAVEYCLRTGTPFEFDERIVRPDGTVRMLHSQGTWFRDAQGRPMKLVGICQDITERKEAEERLRRSELLELEVRQRKHVEQLLRARNEELKTFAYDGVTRAQSAAARDRRLRDRAGQPPQRRAQPARARLRPADSHCGAQSRSADRRPAALRAARRRDADRDERQPGADGRLRSCRSAG